MRSSLILLWPRSTQRATGQADGVLAGGASDVVCPTAQAEAQFRRGNVLDACLRADYLIASLLPATLKSVRDILTNAAADDDTVHERL